ncbi:lactose ABC transporter permease [Paenibacillus baekrokdamisoli]|uniref:Lactose ABC transporter permease n=1 Tax=Paenibacillus baekrokdamisoli TaxID=1712516 RepID=A0A3G9JIZ6_9BACL|nr:sugar ABC transporter permease [Paenibacillus baekrokdamisoli]MBB3069464.1 ABC-type sugar transport system permease subunit [Paenibacillus baekrokdamisoli]BBH24963.1 lactose ABC transporter permease [Paenibacillus baekrokdamisoli]
MRLRWTLERKRGLIGLLFLVPWILGFMLFFAVPFIQSLVYSFNTISLQSNQFTLDYQGIRNYTMIFTEHPSFNRVLTESVIGMIVNVPLILVFSLFAAVLINQKFRGRFLVRAIFFLPVILASGAILAMESGDFMTSMMKNQMSESSGNLSTLKSGELENLLSHSGVSPWIIVYLTGAVNRIYQIISSSGVQILIFLAGLQSIPTTLYESSKLEGATAYEAFWKITFPLVSPLVLTNIIYTIIDSFNNNAMTKLMKDTAFISFEFGRSASMSWVYFTIITIILAVSFAIISKKVFYHD